MDRHVAVSRVAATEAALAMTKGRFAMTKMVV